MFLNTLPTLSSANIMAKMKGVTSKKLREEFPHLRHLPSLWTRTYFVSITGNVSTIIEHKKQGGEACDADDHCKNQIDPYKRTSFYFAKNESRIYIDYQ